MPEPTERVLVTKQESAGTGGDAGDTHPLGAPTNIDPTEDVIAAAGVSLNDGSNPTDQNVKIWRDGLSMMFKDSLNPLGATLTTLITGIGGFTYQDALLGIDPFAETGATDAAYTVTYSAGRVVLEEWERNDSTLIKSIDYTYSGNNVDTEVRKVFDTDGTTITHQVTLTYIYTGNTLTSATLIRDV